jgi:sucrose-6-phosphate hydrolase SacC (GH32 family)
MSPLPYPSLRNPVWQRCDNLRDPAVLPFKDGYQLFYSRFSNAQWDQPENWSVARVFTRDFITFEGDADLTPKGFASPGDPVEWGGRWVLPYQSYPVNPARLFFSESADGEIWSAPAPFLAEVNDLPWNTRHRAIDPSFVVDGDVLHCFFVGSCWRPDIAGLPREAVRHANLIGHAITRDPQLKQWQMLTPQEPMLGISAAAPDGCENVMVIRTGQQWTMIYSEGLTDQHLAVTQSPDLMTWTRLGAIDLPRQPWMARRYGAPFIWREPEGWVMILMGEDDARRTTFGLLGSPDGVHWRLVAARS